MRILPAADYRSQPWKNGGGALRLVASWPARVRGYGDDLLWQVGLPAIERSGPFSVLDGLDRHWMLLAGNGATLHCVAPAEGIDFAQTLDRPFSSLAFRGEWATRCTLVDGPVTALSVLARRGVVASRLETIDLDTTRTIEKPVDEHCIVLAGAGTVRVLAQGAAHSLGALDALWGQPGRFESYSVSNAKGAPATIVVARLGELD